MCVGCPELYKNGEIELSTKKQTKQVNLLTFILSTLVLRMKCDQFFEVPALPSPP